MTSIISLQDLQSSFRQTPSHNEELLKAIPQLSDYELIILLVNRYNGLDDNIGNHIIKEVSDRKLNKETILKLHASIIFYENPLNGYCPCCQTRNFTISEDNKITFCLICSYDIYYDNPKSIWNRIRWKFKIYSFSTMKAKHLLELLKL